MSDARIADLEFELELAKGNYENALARCRELKAAAADAAARPEIRGQSAMQMVIAISLIARSCPDAGFQEIHDLWAAHADADNAEQKRKDAANAGPQALRSFFADWLSAGAPQDKCLCACLEPGCPTFDKTYVRGVGFVDRRALEEEQERVAAPADARAHVAEAIAYESAVADLQATCAAANAEILERAAATKKKAAAAKPRSWAAVVRG